MRPTLLAVLPFVATLLWALALMLDPGPYHQTSMLLIGSGLLLLGTVGTVGLVTMGARWARRTLLGVLAATLVVAVVRPVDLIWMIALASTSVALAYVLAPGPRLAIRTLASATGPPARSVLVTIGALTTPLVMGLVPAEPNVWVIVFASSGPVASLMYSRVLPGGLVALRIGLPAVAIVTGLMMPVAHLIAAGAQMAALTALSWSKEVAVAFAPLVETGTRYPIPPELAPKEILDGAGIDDKGRRL